MGAIILDLRDSSDMVDTAKCEHFSIRGYVSEMRKKDWKICWPFPVHECEEQPSLPPLDVPKFRVWFCNICGGEIIREISTEGINHEHGHNCSNETLRSCDHEEAPLPDTHKRLTDIDLNKPFDPNGGRDGLPDHEIGLGDDLNDQVTSVSLQNAHLGFIERMPTDDNERGSEGNEVSNIELATSNLKCVDGNSAEIHNECTWKELGNEEVTEADNMNTDHATGHLCLELPVAGDDPMPLEIEESDFVDHHSSSRRRCRKKRLLSEIIRKIEEIDTKKITIQESSTHDPSSIPPEKIQVEGDSTLKKRCQSRKRKFIPPENEVINLEEAVETIDTAIGAGFKDASNTNNNKKIQVVDHDMISEQHKGQQTQNECTAEVANKAYSSETLSSKGKRKMVQADDELEQGPRENLFCRENDIIVQHSSAHTRAINMSSIPISVPIPLAQNAFNEQGPQETLNLSLRLPFPLPIQEGTSKAHETLYNGKGTCIREVTDARNTEKTAAVKEVDISGSYIDLTAEEEESEQEVVEFLAQKLYEKSLSI